MKRIIAADIGGTNSRFAVFIAHEDGTLELSRTSPMDFIFLWPHPEDNRGNRLFQDTVTFHV
jgi:glucokinase